jgi:DMSO reductase anchor subunit
MHPAYSVIFFTTASGAGYGLWVLLAIRLLFAGVPDAPAASIVALVLGGILVSLGLLSSTFHLGHPERAWRALGQWRSSWLSREGVAAVATYLPAGLLFLALVLPGGLPGTGLFAALLALGAVGTVWCTGMIYASLRTVPEWNHGLVPVIYLVLALATGAVLLAAVDAVSGRYSVGTLALAVLALAAGAVLKRIYWRRIDGAPAPYTIAQALGIPGASAIRPLDPPHTQPNFVMREMGYAVGRKHAARLRLWVMVLLFAAPLGAILIALLAPAGGALFLTLAVLSAAAGVWVERWLFFAEARHVSMLYYGATLGGVEAPAQ